MADQISISNELEAIKNRKWENALMITACLDEMLAIKISFDHAVHSFGERRLDMINGKGVAVMIGLAAMIAVLIYWQSRRMPTITAAPVEEPQVRPGTDVPKEGPIYDITPESVVDGPVEASTALAVPPKQENTVEVFQHNPNYRVVIFRGIKYFLTLYQSKAIEALHKAVLSGFDEVHQDVILEANGTCGKRLRDVFKSNMAAFRALVAKGVRKGTFRLAAI